MQTRELHHDQFWTSPASFVGSLCVHLCLAWLIITNLNSCGQQGNLGPSDVYREVGITFESPETEVQEEAIEQPVPQPEPLPELPTLPETTTEVTEIPRELLPELPLESLIGPGPASMQSAPNFPDLQSLKTSLPTLPEATTGIPSTTKFFDIATRGQILVYVIDCSGSMSRNKAFRHAKAELMASLERLNGNHKFHVIFYNDQIFEFLGRDREADVQWATAANLTQARSFIAEMDNSGGTAHSPALLKALSYSPEVVFFLTDAADPPMTSRQLEEIRRANRGRAAIHCIEFGIQPEGLKIPNFLQKLSHEHGGTYRYRDTNLFSP